MLAVNTEMRRGPRRTAILGAAAPSATPAAPGAPIAGSKAHLQNRIKEALMSTRYARLGTVLAATFCAAAMAALPAPGDAARAQAAEAAARAAWSNKVAAYQLCKSQDAVAAAYFAEAKRVGKSVAPPVATSACTDPGQYVTPTSGLEAAGAHSPPAMATSPPSRKATEAQLEGRVPK
jgi:hypothetical protein